MFVLLCHRLKSLLMKIMIKSCFRCFRFRDFFRFRLVKMGTILSINMANDLNRKYREVWIGLGGVQSAVYATEVSAEEYFAYTTEETEKLELMNLAEKLDGNIELAIRQLTN